MKNDFSARDSIHPIDVKLMHEYLGYNDGALFWKKFAGCRALKGARAGTINSRNYRVVALKRIPYLESRVIWAMHFGDTEKFIDHIDGNTLNNRIENLRVVDAVGNATNTATRQDNTSGCRNVYWNKKKSYWEVRINVKGKHKYIGSYKKDYEAAVKAALIARELYHGELASFR